MKNYRNLVLILILMSVFPSGNFTFGQSDDSSEINELNGREIKNIYVNNIDVAGPSINDGESWQPDIFGEIGNSLHLKTKAWVIRNILLFKAGQKFNQQSIEDSERLLRESGYFYDAKIEVRPADETGKVNVRVITKDKWTLYPQISYSPKNRNGYAGLSNKNFLGIGHSADLRINHNQDPHIGWGGNLDYTINNIKGSFINASLDLQTDNKSNHFQLGLSRSFITAGTKWAGGLDFTWQHDDLRYVDGNNNINLIPHSYDSQDLWTGRSFPVTFGSAPFKKNSSFILSGRYYRKHYRIRPAVLADSNKIFENHRLYLFSFGLLNREFYKSYFVNGFGVTEDVPVGGMISFTTGSDAREFYNRWYFGTQLVYSALIKRIGYFSGNFEVGGFRYSDKWEQNIVKLDFLYHSPLYGRNGWKTRLFIQNNNLFGFNRFIGEQIYLDRASGMPGFNDLALPGVKRSVLEFEMRFFTPYSILGFVIGGIAFADYGLIAEEDRALFSSKLYQGYGFGLRTQNQSISRTNFELAMVYNPYNPMSGKSNLEITFSAAFVLGIRNFNFNEPEIVKFSDDE